jgi:hypothetical protein
MELLVVGVLTVLCGGTIPAALSHGDFVHAGELINRDNVRTSLG